MTEVQERINPFVVGSWPPMKPLCPWQDPVHRHYYVSVDSTENAYQDFVAQMREDLSPLCREGRLVLVTGESQSGKTALVHRCAYWVRKQATGLELKAEIVDLTPIFLGLPEQTIPQRMAEAGRRLFDELDRRGCLRSDALTDLRKVQDKPESLYPRMSDALVAGTVLLVLLPVVELADEVKRYATMVRANVMFFVESAALHLDQAEDIVADLEQWMPPISLHVGLLRDGDARRFVEHRMTRHAELGRFPGLAEDSVETVAALVRTVGELHRTLLGTYDEARRSLGEQYDSGHEMRPSDFAQFRARPKGGGRARQT